MPTIRHKRATLPFTPDQELKALSYKQPYASLMLNGKRYETRTWPTHYRGWVLICASAIPYSNAVVKDISGLTLFIRILTKLGQNLYVLPRGKAIAIGRISDCKQFDKQHEQDAFVEYWPGEVRYVHEYADVIPLPEPIPWRGAQGWRFVSDEIKQQIFEQLKHVQ